LPRSRRGDVPKVKLLNARLWSLIDIGEERRVDAIDEDGKTDAEAELEQLLLGEPRRERAPEAVVHACIAGECGRTGATGTFTPTILRNPMGSR
jgi:hypothetical protein